MVFAIFISIIIVQRVSELLIAKRNERWMKKQGAIEFGQSHYPFIVIVHSLFIICFIMEVVFFNKELSSSWPILFFLLLLIEVLRLWTLRTLGVFWNTKIIVLPNASVVKKGPYRFIKHPNYIVVAAEFILLPFIFEAYITAIVFSLLNVVILMIRIPAEEKALMQLTKYETAFATVSDPSKDVNKV